MANKISPVPFSGTKEQEQKLLEVIAAHKDTQGALISVLQQAQDIYGYLPIEVQKIIAEKMGVPEAIIAQAWLLQNPDVSAILSGPRTVEMLDDTIKALDVTFTEEQIKELETIFPSHGMNKQGTLVTEHVEATDAYNW